MLNSKKLKKKFFSDTKNWKAYGKKGPALICETGWSDMLNKVKLKVLRKKYKNP